MLNRTRLAFAPLRPIFLSVSFHLKKRPPKMPYYVYRMLSEREPVYVADYPKYREAKLKVNELRKAETEPQVVVRMMHARSEAEAEKLLMIPRDNRKIGDD